MNIGELFVTLGIKGAKATREGLSEVDKGMKGAFSSSMALKAGVLAVVYGLQRMSMESSRQATEITAFGAATDISTEKLQRLNYAAKQFGVEGQEVQGTLKGIQSAMTQMLMGKGAPEGMRDFVNRTGFDLSRARETLYVFEKLQEYSQKAPVDLGRQLSAGFGIGDNMYGAMRRNAFNPRAMSGATVYSEGQLDQLRRVGAAWSNIGNKIERAMGRISAKDGMSIVNNVSKVTDGVIKLAEALSDLASKAKIFEHINTVITGWADIFGFAGELMDDTKRTNVKNPLEILTDRSMDMYVKNQFAKSRLQAIPSVMHGPASPTDPQGKQNAPVLNVTQYMDFSNVDDPRAVSSGAARGIDEAFSAATSRKRKN